MLDEAIRWLGSGLALGFVYAALPGAVNTEALRRGASGGARRSLATHLGALFGSALWATLALTGTTLLTRYRSLSVALGVAGAVFLLWLAWLAARSALRPHAVVHERARRGGDVGAGVVVSIANPAGLPFWAGLAAGVVNSEASEADVAAVAFLVGVLAGSIAWGSLLSALIGWGRRFLSPGFFRTVNACCAVLLVAFAARMIWALGG